MYDGPLLYQDRLEDQEERRVTSHVRMTERVSDNEQHRESKIVHEKTCKGMQVGSGCNFRLHEVVPVID